MDTVRKGDYCERETTARKGDYCEKRRLLRERETPVGINPGTLQSDLRLLDNAQHQFCNCQ